MAYPPRLLLLALSALLTTASTGCVFYGDDDGDDDCVWAADEPYYGLRNPNTNECESWGGGGGGGCYGDDTPGVPEDYAMPNWASCPAECEGLDELSCQGTSGCRATYIQEDCGPDVDCDAWYPPVFDLCVGVAPAPVAWESCEGLDAEQCSQSEDCSAVYTKSWEDEGVRFSYCQAEPWVEGCYSDMDCGAGYECTADTECLPPPGCDDPMGGCPDVCYGQCVPVSSCATVDCGPGYHCEEQCYPCDDADGDGVCPAYCETVCVPDVPNDCSTMMCEPGTHCETVCYGDCGPEGCVEWCESQCVPDGGNPGSCEGDVFCESLPPTCPEGTTPGISDGCWTGYCIPLTDCEPSDPGECYLPVACDMAPPACPEGTTPGVSDGCYTGYCIPEWQCGTTSSCEALDEAACAARFDCMPLYTGNGCTCYPDGTCECVEWQFERCTALYDTFP